MHDYPYPYINDSQNPNYIDETINEKQTPHFRFVVSIETTSRRADPRCIDKFKPRKNEQQYRISRVIGKHWSIIVWSSIEQTTIVRNEKRKKEKYRMILDTVLQWSIVSTVRTCYTHWTHSNEVCFSNGFSLPRPYTHKVHFPRMYLARLPFELRDGISSIYIYIYTPGIKASLHLWLSFTDRLTDCTGPQYIALTFRMKRHIPWSGEWYYGAGNESTRSGGENLLFNRFCVKSK